MLSFLFGSHHPLLTTCSLALTLSVITLRCSAEDPPYTNCALANYYSTLDTTNLPSINRNALEDLLYRTHRNVIPYTSNSRLDTWDALAELDPGDSPNTVRLIYSQTSVPAATYGDAASWNREHVWPKSHGVNYTGADFSDLHHLRPADWNVNAARNNLYFGMCSNDNTCQSPAHVESAADTAKNQDIFTPPAIVRGDLARALFYMDVRYSAITNNGDDLILTDCTTRSDTTFTNGRGYMGYLSVLLQWHIDDPVTDEERERNGLVCENWQGNRNPFVDFPDLVQLFFGDPQTEPYECDDDAGETPTSSVTFSSLAPGDVMVVAVHSDNPDIVALVALAEIPRGSRIYVTDNAWTGEDFLDNEGNILLTVSQTISVGTVFGYGGDLWTTSGLWSTPDAGFSLAAGGEMIHVYTIDDEDGSVVHLSSLSFNGDWDASNSEFDTGSSALPSSVADYSIVLPHFDNYVYSGPTQGGKRSLQNALTNSVNWKGSNTETTLASELLSSFDVTLTAQSISAAQESQLGAVGFSFVIALATYISLG